MKVKKSLSLVSMLCGISALFFYPGIIFIQVCIGIENMPLNYTIIGYAAFISAILGIGLGIIVQREFDKTGKSSVMSIIGIVCSNIMILLLNIAGIFMILEELNIFKLFA